MITISAEDVAVRWLVNPRIRRDLRRRRIVITDEPEKGLEMTTGMRTIMYPVVDLDAAKSPYGEMCGVEPHMNETYHVGYNMADQNIALDPNGHSKRMTGLAGYFHVADIEAVFDSLVARRATKVRDITNLGGGRLIATAHDPDGNVIGLLQAP